MSCSNIVENNLKKNIYKETHKQLNHSTVYLKLTQHCKIKYTSKNDHKNKIVADHSQEICEATQQKYQINVTRKRCYLYLSLLAFFESIETHFRSDLTSFLLYLFSDQSIKDIFRFVVNSSNYPVSICVIFHFS